MIKCKRYLANHKSDGTLRSPAPAASGDKRRIAMLEANLAESESVVKGLEAQLKASEDKDKESNSDNEALVPYGHTRMPLKRGRT